MKCDLVFFYLFVEFLTLCKLMNFSTKQEKNQSFVIFYITIFTIHKDSNFYSNYLACNGIFFMIKVSCIPTQFTFISTHIKPWIYFIPGLDYFILLSISLLVYSGKKQISISTHFKDLRISFFFYHKNIFSTF